MWRTWIFHLNEYLILILNHLRQTPSGILWATWFYLCPSPTSLSLVLHFFSLSLSISPYLSVIWTSCSVALKYCKSCRSVDHHSVLHLESECNVNDMMIPSKATLTLLSFSFFKWKVTLWDNEVNSKLHFNNAEVVLAEHTTKTS